MEQAKAQLQDGAEDKIINPAPSVPENALLGPA